jgi:hypothetical protein
MSALDMPGDEFLQPTGVIDWQEPEVQERSGYCYASRHTGS